MPSARISLTSSALVTILIPKLLRGKKLLIRWSNRKGADLGLGETNQDISTPGPKPVSATDVVPPPQPQSEGSPRPPPAATKETPAQSVAEAQARGARMRLVVMVVAYFFLEL